ncbi:MAG: hypothetical protein HDT22_00630 [Ruminococcus sp.]|nr:hypothetical protein [Ruminococcus sp.]
MHKYNLKPCPFCGGIAEFKLLAPSIFESNSDTAIYVECSNCKIRTKSVEKSIDYTAKEIVAEIWNTRKNTLVNGSNGIK